MPRIRTVKPEFWEDELIATLTRDARLLFIACFNIADDEGLLRWTAAFIKAQAFIYDDDLDVDAVETLMQEITDSGLVFPYVGGTARQKLGWIVNFHKHQKVNRPQPSKLPAPSIQNGQVKQTYGRRDGYVCHVCQGPIDRNAVEGGALSLDHLRPRIAGGSDHPSNIRSSHASCNKGRGARGVPAVVVDSVIDSVNDSLNPAAPLLETFSDGRGRGKGYGSGTGGGGDVDHDVEPPSRCPRHLNSTDDAPCRACGDARRAHDRWIRAQKSKPTPTAVPDPSEPRCTVEGHERYIARNCRGCAADRKAAS